MRGRWLKGKGIKDSVMIKSTFRAEPKQLRILRVFCSSENTQSIVKWTQNRACTEIREDE